MFINIMFICSLPTLCITYMYVSQNYRNISKSNFLNFLIFLIKNFFMNQKLWIFAKGHRSELFVLRFRQEVISHFLNFNLRSINQQNSFDKLWGAFDLFERKISNQNYEILILGYKLNTHALCIP